MGRIWYHRRLWWPSWSGTLKRSVPAEIESRISVYAGVVGNIRSGSLCLWPPRPEFQVKKIASDFPRLIRIWLSTNEAFHWLAWPQVLQNQLSMTKSMISLDAKRADAFLQTYDAYSATVGEDICSTGERVTLDNGEVKRRFLPWSPCCDMGNWLHSKISKAECHVSILVSTCFAAK